MAVRKRVRDGKVTWIADYLDQQGKRHTKSCGTQREAKDWLAQTVVDVKEGIHTPPSATTTVAEAGEQWIDQGKRDGLERSTLEGYDQHLRLHIIPHIGKMKLAELLPAHVQYLRDRLTKTGASANMANRVVVSLGALLACAMSYGKVGRNVVRDTARHRSTRQRRLDSRHAKRLEVGVDIPTPEETRTILHAAEGRWRPLVVTAIFTGMRASELRGLTWNDVDLNAETVTVRQRADRWNAIGSPKSSAGKRTIPLAPMVVNTLKEWKLACPKGQKNLVFPNQTGGIESHIVITRCGLGPLLYKAGITKIQAIKDEHPGIADGAAASLAKRQPKYGMHAFRHAAASLFIAEGFDAKRIQTLMGHSSIQMTFDTYGHLFPNPADDREAMRRVQARLVG